MTDDLLARLTTALMGAMGCERWWGDGCKSHRRIFFGGVADDGWPCPVATRYAEALAPLVRDEIADALEQITRRWQLKDWTDAPRDSDPVRDLERLVVAAFVFLCAGVLLVVGRRGLRRH